MSKQINGLSSNNVAMALLNGYGNSTATTNLLKFNSNGLDSPGAPPPTPMLGMHQESRFTFPDQTRKIPALPDLRTADFFR